MFTAEFSSAFDILYNNISSNKAPAVDAYEKSVFLTKAQSQVLTELFNKKTDAVGEGFDGNQRRQYDFSTITQVSNLLLLETKNITKIDNRSRLYLYPRDYFLAVNETIADNKRQYSVLPINYTEYQRLMLKPYAYPLKKEAWRIINTAKDSRVYDDRGYYFITTNNIEGLVLNIKAVKSSSAINPDNTTWGYTQIMTITYDDNSHPCIAINDDGMTLKIKYSNDFRWVKIVGDYNNNTLNVQVVYDSTDTILDDENTAKILKYCFSLYNTYIKESNITDTSNIAAINDVADGFMVFTSSSNNNFSTGVSLETLPTKATVVEIIGKFGTEPVYSLRYIREPKPIILEDLEEGDSIGGISVRTECELPEELHQDILDRAVLLAKMAWQGTITPAVQNKQQ